MANLRILSLGFQGHLNPLLGIARELVLRGHNIIFHTTADHSSEIAATGAMPVPMAIALK